MLMLIIHVHVDVDFQYPTSMLLVVVADEQQHLPTLPSSASKLWSQLSHQRIFRDEHRYNRVVEVFTYENARRWLVHARESNQTGDCCTTLIWEADRRLNNVVGGSYAAYQQLVQQNTQQTGVIEGLNNEIQLLNTQVNTLTDENALLRGDLGFVCELSFGGEGMRELIFLF
jgi:hypothetical protein